MTYNYDTINHQYLSTWFDEHNQMLAHLHMLVNKEYLVIPKEYDKLIISLRTAYANEYSLDKEQTSYSDSLDALRLACKMYPIKDET